MSEDWLHETQERGEFLDQKDYLIGGNKRAQAALKRDFSDPQEEEKQKKNDEGQEKKVKLVMKVCCDRSSTADRVRVVRLLTQPADKRLSTTTTSSTTATARSTTLC